MFKLFLKAKHGVGSAIDRARSFFDSATPRGVFSGEIHRADGTIEKLRFKNGVCTLGFNLMLDSTFRNGTATLYPNWYIGLIGTSGFSALAVGDTAASHTGWTEDSTHYTAANRPQWSPTAAASKSITNTSSVNFAINTDSTVIKGIFVISDNTLGGTSGLLYSAGLFSSDQTLFNGDTLKITYTVSLS